MATYYSQGSGAWSTLTNWDTNAGGGGSDPASVAAMGDNVFIIQAAHVIEFDVDMSGFANGIAGLTITGGATPGMLYSKHSGDGTYYLMIKTGTAIVGTTDTNRGRLLANSDGTWGNTGVLPFGRKFTIDLKGTAVITATDLDIALHCTEPGIKYVEAYLTKYTCTEASTDVNPATDLITWNEATPPAAGAPVMLRTAGTLPGGLTVDSVYYVRTITDAGATFTCKLALQNSDATIVDITSAGSGALYMYTGHASTSTATMNIIQDVTGDAQWVSGASIVLVDANAPESYDQQRVTINGAPGATSIVLSANVDSVQYPLARIYLVTRNIAIRNNGTSGTQAIVAYAITSTHGGTFGCEIRNTAGSGTTFYNRGIYYGVGVTMSGVISGCSDGINTGTNFVMSGIITSTTYGFNACVNTTMSGTVVGCSGGIYASISCTISGTVLGCTNGISTGSLNIVSGVIIGCTSAFSGGTGHTMSGTVLGCAYCLSGGGVNHIVSGSIIGCTYGFYICTSCKFIGTIYGSILCRFFDDGPVDLVVGKNASYPNPTTYYGRNVNGHGARGVRFENYLGVKDAHRSELCTGDVIKNTTVLRSGGADNSIEVVPLSACSVLGPIPIFEWVELDVPEDSAITKTIYIRADAAWSTYPTGDSSGTLYFEAEYYNHASLLTTAKAYSTEVLSDGTTWVAFTCTFTPLQVGPVRYRAYLKQYEASRKIYVDNAVYTS